MQPAVYVVAAELTVLDEATQNVFVGEGSRVGLESALVLHESSVPAPYGALEFHGDRRPWRDERGVVPRLGMIPSQRPLHEVAVEGEEVEARAGRARRRATSSGVPAVVLVQEIRGKVCDEHVRLRCAMDSLFA